MTETFIACNEESKDPVNCLEGSYMFQGSCYFIINEDEKWETSLTNCENLGTGWTLACIHNKGELEFIDSVINPTLTAAEKGKNGKRKKRSNSEKEYWLGGSWARDTTWIG